MTLSTTLFVVSNLGITAGYIFLALFVLPRVTVHLVRTKVGGIGFFLLCGLHHLDNTFHLLYQTDLAVGHVFLEWHMLAIDIPQFICVWLFVTGLYVELVKWGPWRTEDPEWMDRPERRKSDTSEL